MDFLFSLGLKRRRVLHEVYRGGLTAQVVEVVEKDHYYAILVTRARSKELVAELRMPEFAVSSELIQNCWDYIRKLVGADIVATLQDKELPHG